jgi:hypothetical protein
MEVNEMKKRFPRHASLLVLAVGLLFIAASLAAALPQTQKAKVVAAQALEIRNLSVQARLQMIGRSATIRGYYSNKSVPLIVDDINRMMVREPLPPGSYILLSGAIPANIRHGDHLEVQGTIIKPTAASPAHLQGEQTVLQLSATPHVIGMSVLRPTAPVSKLTVQQLRVASSHFQIHRPGTVVIPKDYAVLINGGINAANYWCSFYNDLVISYNMLLGRGYLPSNITVINANGGGAPPGSTPCGSIPVNYAATSANVTTVFNQLAAKMTSEDTLCVIITDHGGTGVICLWGENMSYSTFTNLVNGISHYTQMTFCFDLCHSGGLIPYVLGQDRLVFAACDSNRGAYDSSHGHYGALIYAFISALTGLQPAGGAVNADSNGDSRISLAETFNYVRAHIDSGGSQTPHYNDDIAMPDTTGVLPQGSDGSLGAISFI